MTEQRSVAALCLLSLFPAAVITGLAWFWAPTWNGGRALVTISYGAVVLLALRLGSRRCRTFQVARGSTLLWEPGIERDDPYSVALHAGGKRELLLEGDEPARVLADARRIASETGARLLGPEWVVMRQSLPPDANALVASSEQGLLWPAQLRASRTALFGALFVLLSFVGSIHAESEISTLSASLPLVAAGFGVVVGALLGRMRIWIYSGPEGLRAERRGFGAPRPLLSIPLAALRGVHAVGHPSYGERHLLIETESGPVSLPCAESAARRVAELWTRSARNVN